MEAVLTQLGLESEGFDIGARVQATVNENVQNARMAGLMDDAEGEGAEEARSRTPIAQSRQLRKCFLEFRIP
eukprot:6764125-Alexandrium_andersonii.AAC.1